MKHDQPFYVLVTGGRDFHDVKSINEHLHAALMRVRSEPGRRMVVVQGGATGADTHAEKWAKAWKVPYFTIPAEWNRYGHGAGAVRNDQMLNWLNIELVVAFPGGAGTLDMINRATDDGIGTITVEYKS